MIPRFGLPLLAKELSTVARENEYRRINPYKFQIIDRHVYILFAEPNPTGYEIKKKLILRQSHKGNVRIPEETFLYDVLDYFVELKLLNKEYKFIGHVRDNIGMTVVDVIDKDELIKLGFKFPV